jgi:hypothetical protein
MIGDLAIRDGWELAHAGDVKPVAAPAPKTPQHRPVLECNADGPELTLGSIAAVSIEPSPGLSWVTTEEASSGAIDVVAMPRGARTASTIALLPASTASVGERRDVTAEGAFAVRIPKLGGATVDVEVAWWVASTGKVHHAAIANGAPPLPRGVPSPIAAIVPGYGLYLHLPNSPIWLVRETGAVVATPAPPTFPSVTTLAAHRTGARTLFSGLPVQIYGDRSMVFANMSDRGVLDVLAWNLWPRSLDRTRPATISSSADRIVVAWPGNEAIAAHTWALAVRDPLGEPPEPLPLPTAKDDLPPCSKSATGPRASLPWVAGSRTPVIVHAGLRTLFHATENVIVRGNCAAGIEAGPPSMPRATELTFVGSDLHGFAFTPSRHAETVVPIACAPSAAPLPKAYATARGM